MEKLCFGIDIGGTGTKYGIVDRNGNILFAGEISTKKSGKLCLIFEIPEKIGSYI